MAWKFSGGVGECFARSPAAMPTFGECRPRSVAFNGVSLRGWRDHARFARDMVDPWPPSQASDGDGWDT